MKSVCKFRPWLSLSVAPFLLIALPHVANAELKREGVWPDTDPKLSLDLAQTPRNEAVRKVAEAGGLSLAAEGVGTTLIDLHVKDAPPGDALALALGEGEFIAKREGNAISLRPTSKSALSVSVDHDRLKVAVTDDKKRRERAHDRRVTGQALRIEKDEVVQDIHVTGGSVEVAGTVQGDIHMTGGPVHVLSGAHVVGDVRVTGGRIQLDDGAIVDGDLRVIGGAIERAPGAKVGGDVHASLSSKYETGTFFERIGQAISAASMLFVFGAILIALLGRRQDVLERELASRPMRTFAVGAVGLLAFALTITAACITIVGIPVAMAGAVAGAFGLYAGIIAALSVIGCALSRHKTTNRYLHLGVGCIVFLVLGHLPWGIGDVATLLLGLVGWGAVVSTRGAGLFSRAEAASFAPGEGPYRTPA